MADLMPVNRLIQLSPGALQTIIAARTANAAAEAEQLRAEVARLAEENEALERRVKALRRRLRRQAILTTRLAADKRAAIARAAEARSQMERDTPVTATVRWIARAAGMAIGYVIMMEIWRRMG